MKRTILLILITLSAFIAQAQVQFTVEVPNVVASGERFRLVYTATDAKVDAFNAPRIEGFSVLAGPTTSTMNRVEYVNGRRTQSRSVSYTYILEAAQTGKFRIGEASVTSEGATYKTQPVTVEVVAGNQTSGRDRSEKEEGSSAEISADDIFLRLNVSKKRVVKGESRTATLKLYTRVNVSGAEDIHFPTFNGFWSQEVYAPQQIDWQRENVNGEIYQSAVLRRYVLLPQQTGTITIDPSEIVCVIQVRNASRGNSMLDDFFDSYQTVRKRAVSPSVSVYVNNLPDGAPASFNGAVGKFSLSTKMGKDSILAHDAVSMYITITGEGNINLLEAPKVSFPPDFEVYDVKITDNSRSSGGAYSGSKVFEYPVIPRSHGAFTMDPVTFSYYDVESRQYKTLQAAPLTLKVGKSTDTATQGIDQGAGTHRRIVQSLGQDIRYIRTVVPVWHKKGAFFVSSIGFYVIILILFGIFGASYVLLNRRRERRKDIVRVRNSKANKIARTRLKAAATLLKQELFSGYFEEVHRTLWGYIGDKLALTQADYSRERVIRLLEEKKVDSSVISDYMDLIEACEFARYAPDPGQVEKEKIFERAMAAISKMEQGLKL